MLLHLFFLSTLSNGKNLRCCRGLCESIPVVPNPCTANAVPGMTRYDSKPVTNIYRRPAQLTRSSKAPVKVRHAAR